MIDADKYLQLLLDNQVTFFTGVPDSLLKGFCTSLSKGIASSSHIIATNEGSAVGLAIGHYLASREIPLVYMQNSGFGNAINPLLSLASNEVLGIPMVLMIGWRGEPGVHDEPQHIHQGRVTMPIIESMGIQVEILSSDFSVARLQTIKIIKSAAEQFAPVALLVRARTFESSHSITRKNEALKGMSREAAVMTAAKTLDVNSLVVATTGMIGRELFEYRQRSNITPERDLLCVGGMGHANQVALGLALAKPESCVVCFDGDGAVLMHLGSLAIVGQASPARFLHIVFNNGAHDSVGGQPTVARSINLCSIAIACGYHNAVTVDAIEKLKDELVKRQFCSDGPSFIEVIVEPGHRDNLARPNFSPSQNKEFFMVEG